MATTYSDSIAKFGRHVFGDAATYPIRKIELSDLSEALRRTGHTSSPSALKGVPLLADASFEH